MMKVYKKPTFKKNVQEGQGARQCMCSGCSTHKPVE